MMLALHKKTKAVEVAAISLLILHSAFPKSLYFRQYDQEASIVMNTDIQSLECRLKPFLERLINRRSGRRTLSYEVNPYIQRDIFLAVRKWNSLSAGFRQLYKSAVQVPDSFLRYDSPGGNFEIYYTTSGINGVDSSDLYGFSSMDWKTRIESPNGIPDYIDEAAFALDSSWSMEIERFGFIAPTSYKNTDARSGKYRIVVEEQDYSFYGLTYLLDKLEEDRGYSSMISLRNDWSGEEWKPLGYDVHPCDGLRVTCAHEFFHAIQYAMCWNVLNITQLDDFPLGWTEGSAVSMEELAFDSVNDYHQYATSYFNHPSISFLSGTNSDQVYTNALLILYLFKHFPPGNSISFIRDVTFTNYRNKTPFHQNILSTAIESGITWKELLHNFHKASFFTGTNSDTSVFISDAPYFNFRPLPASALTTQINRTVSLNSAEFIRLVPEDHHPDTLSISLSGEALEDDSALGCGWACSAVLKNRQENSFSFIPIIMDRQGKGSVFFPDWKKNDDIVLIVTNGDPLTERNITISFNADTIPTYRDIGIFPNPVSFRKHQGKLNIRGNKISSISIYSVNGNLVWHSTAQTTKSSPYSPQNNQIWDCRNNQGAAVAPGTYTIIVVRKDRLSDKTIHSRHKLLVAP